MSERIKLVQGDTKPALILSLTDENSGEPIGISGSTTRMYFREAGTTTILATLTGTLLAGKVLEDGTIDTDAPYDTPGAGGRVQFNWGSTDLDQDPGNYEGEVEITFSDGTIQTVYDLLKFRIRQDF
jgi:hypothetical protein